MPNHKLLGKKQNHLNKSENYDETRVSFEEITTSPKTDQIQQSESQRGLDQNKVVSMIDEYISNPHFLKFKNRIVMALFNDKWYLVDGQHRLEMAKRGYSEYGLNDELVICWYHCNNEDEMRKLFNSLNQDSAGNQYYINQGDIQQSIIDEVVKLLKRDYKHFFHKDNNSDTIYSIQGFRDKLIEINYFDSFNNYLDCYGDIKVKNDSYYKICDYDRELSNNEGLDGYYDSDKSRIKSKFILPCKNSNFMQWLVSHDDNDAYHKRKKAKQRIPQNVRNKCWEREFGTNGVGICPITECTNELRRKGKGGYQAGHIFSEKNGGKVEFMNLRPICAECNRNMAHHNWDDYDSLGHRDYLNNL